MKDYQSLPDLVNIYLEDSYILAVEATPGRLILQMEFVLTEDHPAFIAPGPHHQYCYHDGRLLFSAVRELRWSDQRLVPFTDATGEKDFGNIDSLKWEDRHSLMYGDVGRVEVFGDLPAVELA